MILTFSRRKLRLRTARLSLFAAVLAAAFSTGLGPGLRFEPPVALAAPSPMGDQLVKFAINPRTGAVAFGDRFDYHDELASRVGAVDDYVWGEYYRGSEGPPKLHIGVNTLQDAAQQQKWSGEHLGRYLASDQFAASAEAQTFRGAQVLRGRQAIGYYDPTQGVVLEPLAPSGTASVLASLPPRDTLSKAKQGLYDQLMITERNGLRNLDTPGANPLYPKKFFPLIDMATEDGSKFISHERSGTAASAEYKLTKLLNEVGRRRESAVTGLKELGLLGPNDDFMTFFDRVEVRVPADLVEEARAILAERIANVDPTTGQITFSIVDPKTGTVTSGFPGGDEFVRYLMTKKQMTGEGLLQYFLNKIQGYDDADGALVNSTPGDNSQYLKLPENPLKAPEGTDLEKPDKAKLEEYKNLEADDPRAKLAESLERGGREALEKKLSSLDASTVDQLDHADQAAEPEEARRAMLQEVVKEAEAELAKLDATNRSAAQQAIDARKPALEAVLEDTQSRLFNQQSELVRTRILRGRTWLGTKYGQYLESIKGVADAPLQDRVVLFLALWNIAHTYYEVPPWEGDAGHRELGHFILSWIVVHEVSLSSTGMAEAFGFAGGILTWVVIAELTKTILEALGGWMGQITADVVYAQLDEECVKTFYLGEAYRLSMEGSPPPTDKLGLFNMPGSPVGGLNRDNFMFRIKSPEMLRALVGRHRVVAMRELDRRHNILPNAEPVRWYSGRDEDEWDRCWAKVEEAAFADWQAGYKKLLAAMKEVWEKDRAKQLERERTMLRLPTRGELDGELPHALVTLFPPITGPIPEQGGTIDVSFDWMVLGLPGQKEQPALRWSVQRPDGSTEESAVPAEEVRFDVGQIARARTFKNTISAEKPGQYSYKLEVTLPSGDKQSREGSFSIQGSAARNAEGSLTLTYKVEGKVRISPCQQGRRPAQISVGGLTVHVMLEGWNDECLAEFRGRRSLATGPVDTAIVGFKDTGKTISVSVPLQTSVEPAPPTGEIDPQCDERARAGIEQRRADGDDCLNLSRLADAWQDLSLCYNVRDSDGGILDWPKFMEVRTQYQAQKERSFACLSADSRDSYRNPWLVREYTGLAQTAVDSENLAAARQWLDQAAAIAGSMNATDAGFGRFQDLYLKLSEETFRLTGDSEAACALWQRSVEFGVKNETPDSTSTCPFTPDEAFR